MTHEGAMPYLAIEQNLPCKHVLAVYVTEDSEILRTSFKWKCDGKCVTVCSGEIAVLRNKLKAAPLLDGSRFMVNKDFHIIVLT
jgi:hypothetical protein